MSNYNLANVPVSTDYITINDLNDKLANYLQISGGTVYGNLSVHQHEMNILSGNFKQTNSDNVRNYSAKNAFIQAEVAGNNYGPAYTGTKGYCILGINTSLNEIKLSGNIQAIANFLNGQYLDDSYNPKNAPGLKNLYSTASGERYLVAYQLSDVRFSYAIADQAASKSIEVLSIVEMEEEYGIISVANIPSDIVTYAGNSEEWFEDKFINDDNALYAIGFPELGNLTIKNFYAQHAEGGSVRAIGKYTHAEGRDSNSDGRYAHVEGSCSTAGGLAAHAEGFATIALGNHSHAEGHSTRALAIKGCHAEGYLTTATKEAAHAEGGSTMASGTFAHTEGNGTTASNTASHAEGYNTTASGYGSHSEGGKTTASHNYSHAEGQNTKALSAYSHAEGINTTASNDGSHSEGGLTVASGIYSHAEGSNTQATKDNAHAEGNWSQANGVNSHAEGLGSVASGTGSYASGNQNLASGDYARSIGAFSNANSNRSYVWNGRAKNESDVNYSTSNRYTANGEGTYNINPENGINGFFIGTENLSAIIKGVVENVLREHNLIQ